MAKKSHLAPCLFALLLGMSLNACSDARNENSSSDANPDQAAIANNVMAGDISSSNGAERGQGTKPLLVHFQLRPDPLAN